MQGIEGGLQRIDGKTVKNIELRAPRASTLDAQFLRGQILGGAIFGEFSDQERGIICQNVLRFGGIIPSLSTFFKDILLLELCADVMKRLVTVPAKETVFTTLAYETTMLVQKTESTTVPITANKADCKKLGYLVLVAFAMRWHPSLPKDYTGKNLKTTPRAKADQEVLCLLADLAANEGFGSPEIDKLKGSLTTLPASILQTPTPESPPLLVTTGPGVSLKQRCGIPRTGSFEEDRKYLFLNHLTDQRDETGEGITSFFVLRSWFRAFFDTPSWNFTTNANTEESSQGAPQTQPVDMNETDEIREMHEGGMGDQDEQDDPDMMRDTTDLEQQRTWGTAREANDTSTDQPLGNFSLLGLLLNC